MGRLETQGQDFYFSVAGAPAGEFRDHDYRHLALVDPDESGFMGWLRGTTGVHPNREWFLRKTKAPTLVLLAISLLAAYLLGAPSLAIFFMMLATLPVDWGTCLYAGNFCLATFLPHILVDLLKCLIPWGWTFSSAMSFGVHVLFPSTLTKMIDWFFIPEITEYYVWVTKVCMVATFSVACNCPSQPLCAAVFLIVARWVTWYTEILQVLWISPDTHPIFWHPSAMKFCDYQIRVLVNFCLILTAFGSLLNLIRKAWAVWVQPNDSFEWAWTLFFFRSHFYYEPVHWEVLIAHLVVSVLHMIFVDEWGIHYLLEHEC